MCNDEAVSHPSHALKNLQDREIPQDEVERTLEQPEFVAPDHEGRRIYMRQYHDGVRNQEMLLRVVVEDIEAESVEVTAYRRLQINRYLKVLQT